MAKIVESKSGNWTLHFADIGFALLVATLFAGILHLTASRAHYHLCQPTPSRAPRCLWSRGINPAVLTGGKYVLVSLCSAERLGTAIQFQHGAHRISVKRDFAFACVSLRRDAPNSECAIQ